MRRTLTVLGAALILGASGGIAYSVTSPGAGGVIRACYNTSSGTLKLVDGTTCARGEKPISWNAQGTPGASGVSGYEVVKTTQSGIPPANTIRVPLAVACPTGKVPVGGGAEGRFELNGSRVAVAVTTASHPL